MFCVYCGKEVNINDKFCSNCGRENTIEPKEKNNKSKFTEENYRNQAILFSGCYSGDVTETIFSKSSIIKNLKTFVPLDSNKVRVFKKEFLVLYLLLLS